MITFVLASASPSRLRILEAAGVDPLVRLPEVDEDALAANFPAGAPPAAVVEALARAKAEDVLARFGADIVAAAHESGAEKIAIVGCDSMLLVDGHLEGKPHTFERAWERWTALRGRHGVLVTGHALMIATLNDNQSGQANQPGFVIDYRGASTSDTTVHFGYPSDEDLAAYLRTGEPLECAGAFTLESLGGWFIDRIEGDPSSVIGLSLPLLRRLLSEAGVEVRQLWRAGLRA